MSADNTIQGTSLQRRQDGTTAVPSGGAVDFETGSALKIAGTDVTSKMNANAAKSSGTARATVRYARQRRSRARPSRQ